MFFWNSLAFLMIQQMLAIWSLVPMPFQYFGYLIGRADTLEKTLMLGKIEGRRRKGATEEEMVEWHH